jgi:hypothetical protein
MCANLPLVDPTKITVPTAILRGQWDGIASFDDLMKFFEALEWATTRGARSGRVAWQFIQDVAGRLGVALRE